MRKTGLVCLCSAVVLLGSVLAAVSYAAPAKIGMLARISFAGSYQGGVAVLGSKYVYAGTSTKNILHVMDARSFRRLATWHLPSFGDLSYGMERLALSPDNRTLYVLNTVREDLVLLDTTGHLAPRRWNLHGTLPLDVKPSPDGKRVYVVDGKGADVYDAITGQHLALLDGISEVAPLEGGAAYTLTLPRGGAIISYVGPSGAGHVLDVFHGSPLVDRNGDLATAPGGHTLYVLWDSLRALDARTGRVQGTMPLPLVPHFRWLTVAPNGRQALLTAPDFAGIYDTAGLNPSYVTRHYGFIAGGVLPIDLGRLRPLQLHAEGLTSPRQTAYTSDSRLAFVTTIHNVHVISTGTQGVDHAQYPSVQVHFHGSGSSRPPAPPSATPKPLAVSCSISGPWTFVEAQAAPGPGNGTASLQQSGSKVTGTLEGGGVLWTLSGTVSGRTVNLNMSASGQVPLTFTGQVSNDGTHIVGNLGSFSGHARCR